MRRNAIVVPMTALTAVAASATRAVSRRAADRVGVFQPVPEHPDPLPHRVLVQGHQREEDQEEEEPQRGGEGGAAHQGVHVQGPAHRGAAYLACVFFHAFSITFFRASFHPPRSSTVNGSATCAYFAWNSFPTFLSTGRKPYFA